MSVFKNLLGFKIMSASEWLLSHILLVAGLVLVTIGLVQDAMVLNIIGMWVFVLGLCLGFTFCFRNLHSK
jgi:uncharacterized membrane protein YiaA